MTWTRTKYNEIEWMDTTRKGTTGYGTIARREGEDGLSYELRLFPAPPHSGGNDRLAWVILLNEAPIFTSNLDYTSVQKAILDCEFQCDLGPEACPLAHDGWD